MDRVRAVGEPLGVVVGVFSGEDIAAKGPTLVEAPWPKAGRATMTSIVGDEAVRLRVRLWKVFPRLVFVFANQRKAGVQSVPLSDFPYDSEEVRREAAKDYLRTLG